MMEIEKIFISFCLLSFGSTVHAIVGYDCGSSQLNITTISLLQVGDCNLPESKVKSVESYIQLIQFSNIATTPVMQCKVEIKRTIYHCGMHSHISVVENEEGEYLHEILHDVCEIMHNTGILKLGPPLIISNLRVNETSHHSVTLAGSIGINGECSGTQYSDPFGTWNNVVVQGSLKIKLSQHEGSVNLHNDRIHLKTGLTCPLSQSSCLDEDGGYTFWDPLPKDICQFNKYQLLYEGIANKIQDDTETLFSLATQDITFVLAQKGQTSLCNIS